MSRVKNETWQMHGYYKRQEAAGVLILSNKDHFNLVGLFHVKNAAHIQLELVKVTKDNSYYYQQL